MIVMNSYVHFSIIFVIYGVIDSQVLPPCNKKSQLHGGIERQSILQVFLCNFGNETVCPRHWPVGNYI